ncbi:MAG: response regulator [Lentisphaeria bacterium]|nr:response regulator [Lentisphaeria bacterium]
MNNPKRNRILIVDDVGEYSLAFKMYLPDDAETLIAESAEQARSLFAAHSPVDLAIIDVRLDKTRADDVSGMDLLSWIRERSPETRVIMTSAYQTIEYELEAIERGAIRFLRKPLQPDEIKKALSQVLKP